MHETWLLYAVTGLYVTLGLLVLGLATLAYSRLERAFWVAAAFFALVGALATYYSQFELAVAALLLFAGLCLFGHIEDRRHREVSA